MRKMYDKPLSMIGLTFSRLDGFTEHVSEDVVYREEDEAHTEALAKAGYKHAEGHFFGSTLYENEKSEFRFVVFLDTTAVACDHVPDVLDRVFIRNRVDLMEFMIRIAPVYTAAAVTNLMEGDWGKEESKFGGSFSSALTNLLSRLR